MDTKNSISFKVDDIRPKRMADGSYQVMLSVGEYDAEAVAMLIMLPKGIFKVTVEPEIRQEFETSDL